MSEKPKQLDFEMDVQEVDKVDRLVASCQNLYDTKDKQLEFLDKDWELAKANQQKAIEFWRKQSNLYKELNQQPREITPYMRTNRSAYQRISTL